MTARIAVTPRWTRTPALPQDWRHAAECQDLDPELFFPIGTSEFALQQVAVAKRVCGRCSVHDDCLRWALKTGQEYGVWGGLSETELRSVRRRSRRGADERASR